MKLTKEESLHDLEQLVAAMEDSLAVIAGTIAESSDPRLILMHLCAGKEAFEKHHGQNDWRDRLLRSALKTCALKARSLSSDDPVLQSLIASVLGGRKTSDQTH